MPTASLRSAVAALARLLDRADSPIYALDDARRIIYCNSACAAWTGVPAEHLIGQQCAYTSSGDREPRATLANALCPPPDVWQGRSQVVAVEAPVPGNDRQREITFWPLCETAGDVTGVFALAASAAAAAGVSIHSDDSTPAALHQWLVRFHAAEHSRYLPESLVGKSPAIERVREQTRLAASSQANVLIVGESGSGRKHVARIIIFAAPAESESTLRTIHGRDQSAELFAANLDSVRHEAQRANSIVTLLIEDADRLSPELQVALVELLREHPISGRSSGIRVLSTSASDLHELVRLGKYRADLAARLSTLTVQLPPLAARLEDLPLLAQALLERVNAAGGKQVQGFSSDALDRLALYPWTRNMAEVSEVVRDCHRRAAGPMINVSELPGGFTHAVDVRSRPTKVDERIVLDEFLSRIELELIERALAEAKGNKTRAAELLGMNRPRLYRRLVQLGLVQERDVPPEEQIDFQ